jgi:hypothetical protein
MGRGQFVAIRAVAIQAAAIQAAAIQAAAIQAVAVSAVVWGSACSVLIDSEPQQCSVDEDCVERGRAFEQTECVDNYCTVIEPEVEVLPQQPLPVTCKEDADCDAAEACIEKACVGRWTCIDEAPTTTKHEPIEVSILVATSFGEPMPGVLGKACRSIDPSCGSPVLEATSDETGVLHLALPPDFTGYMEVVAEPFFPVLYYFPAPLTSGMSLPALNLTPAELIQGLGLAVGAAPDPERGHVLIALQSCLGTAPSVHLSAPKADDKTIAYYVQDGIPSADRDVTTAEGSGGFLNFPPGNAVVDLSSGSLDEVGSLSLTVRPGYITNLAFGPSGANWGTP